jgi:hypothetical protein
MFDPSIFLNPETLQTVREELESSGLQAYVPAQFLVVAREGFAWELGTPVEFFGTRETPDAAASFRDWDWGRYLVPYEAPVQPDEDDEVGRALLELQGVDTDVRRILFEEWHYLQHQSWIKAVTDACAKAFERAGGVVHDLGADAFNAFVDKAEKVPELLKRPGVRKAGKWTLATGISIGVEVALLTFFPPGAAIWPAVLSARAGDAARELAQRILQVDKEEQRRKKGFLRFDP